MMRLKSFWHNFTQSKKRKRRKTRENNNTNVYSTLPYYYPTEQVDNVGKIQKKRRKR
jgi:hypothetical protein